MEKVDTDQLRSSASKWTLGGDKRLLDLLQSVHQNIITKCKEANAKLDELNSSLDAASIDLQNVNNKFMGLSNSQFIERRVYDDDIDVQPQETAPKEPPKQPDPNEELLKLKQSIQILESMHEVVEIIDSDSSDEEGEESVSVVLKPKDMYAHRPLPYIIGSEMWKMKWHAGLIAEDSDTDSTGSKPEPNEEYSDSEPEDTHTDKQTKDIITPVSTSTSSVEASMSAVPKPAKPADIAAELARRLGGDTIPPPPPMDTSPPEPTTKKVYKPEQPPRATIFFNEPPPLDQVESDKESDTEDDIFAELHRNSYNPKEKVKPVTNVVDELFGDVGSPIKTMTNPKDKPVLFDDEPESELFLDKSEKQKVPSEKDSNVKKPIGGISLFGSTKDSNSIGAAILKRHQPKSSDEESDNADLPIPKSSTVQENTVSNKNTTRSDMPKSNNISIIDEIFAKPKYKKDASKTTKENVKTVSKDKATEQKAKVDLFSDNLFDDIDDIFTSKVVIKKPENNKSIFDDDLFSDVTLNSSKKDKDILSGSEDELFSDKNVFNTHKPKTHSESGNNTDTANIYPEVNITVKGKEAQNENENAPILNKNNNVILESKETQKISNSTKKLSNIFDDDSDDDLFNSASIFEKKKEPELRATEKKDIKEKKVDIFGDDSDDDLFSTVKETKISNSAEVTIKHSNVDENIDNRIQFNQSSDVPKQKITDQDVSKLTHQIISSNVENFESKPSNASPTLSSHNLNEGKEYDNSIHTQPKQPINLKVGSQVMQEHSPSVFDDDEMNDELVFPKTNNSNIETEVLPAESLKQSEESSVSETNNKPDIPQSSENISFEDTTKYVPSSSDLYDKEINPKEINLQENKNVTIPPTADTKDEFGDVFNDIPPEFEKPKEPKKSKNVNALFGDDSDDESLFFKKSDVLEEVPSQDLYNVSDRFSIFHDEPPAIDVDFTQKSGKFDSISHLADDPLDEMSQKIKESNVSQHTQLHIPEKKDKNLGMSQSVENNQRPEEQHPDIISEKINELQSQSERDESTPKAIGKLKNVNISINVSSLLPGASPKKVKVTEEIDGSVTSKVSDSNTTKNVNFEDDVESGILDNKLSKERAKIQVKRRPSTRRARKEAARKSGIDFGDSFDSPDNSSPVHEQKDTIGKVIDPSDIEKNTNLVIDIKADNGNSKVVKDSELTTKKTKVVYILNDEDIFSDVNDNMREPHDINENHSSPSLDRLNENIDSKSLSNVINTESRLNITNAQASGTDRKVDSNQNKPQSEKKPSIFDLSDSDSELFETKKVKVTPKAKLFDSDSDDGDLFGKSSKSKTLEVKKNVKEKTTTLFSDESDDELFSTSKKTNDKQTTKAKETWSKPSEPVFEDPLSILTQDEI